MTTPTSPVLRHGPVTTLAECPPGLFLFGETMAFKSEYRTRTASHQYQSDAYVLESGEYFWGGAKSSEAREALIVQPVTLAQPAAQQSEAERRPMEDLGDGRWADVDPETVAAAQQSSSPSPLPVEDAPGGWLIRESDGGWHWTGTRIAAVAALTEGLEVVDLAVTRQSAADALEAAIRRAERAEAEAADLRKALEPFARLEVPKKSVGNAGAYSILHSHIRAAQEALSTHAKQEPGE